MTTRCRLTGRQTGRQTHRHIVRHTGGIQTNRQEGRQSGKRTLGQRYDKHKAAKPTKTVKNRNIQGGRHQEEYSVSRAP